MRAMTSPTDASSDDCACDSANEPVSLASAASSALAASGAALASNPPLPVAAAPEATAPATAVPETDAEAEAPPLPVEAAADADNEAEIDGSFRSDALNAAASSGRGGGSNSSRELAREMDGDALLASTPSSEDEDAEEMRTSAIRARAFWSAACAVACESEERCVEWDEVFIS
jgi:hypothetical protein